LQTKKLTAMKRKAMFPFFWEQIKKKFFKEELTVISSRNETGYALENVNFEKQLENYRQLYGVTTRWQTV
jgi:nucleoside diphosphate kinase